MIVIAICIIIGGLLAACTWTMDPAFEAFMGAVGGAFVGIILAMLVGAFAYSAQDWKPVGTTPLVSLADGAGVEGHFFLGSGYVDSKSVFTWYESSGDNSFVRKSADAEESTIHYLTNDKKPYYVRRKQCSVADGFFQTWGLNVGTGCWETHYDFYIPKGSIVQSYKLDNR